MKYAYGYCGMPCALCTRYRTEGRSRCAGCSEGGYYTDVCKVYRCIGEKGGVHCGLCAEYPCAKLGKMGDFKDLNTGGCKAITCGRVARDGFAEWSREYGERAELLTMALARYNNGRMKRYLCELFIRRDIQTLKEILSRAEKLAGEPKELGKAFREIVGQFPEDDSPG